MQRGKCYSLVWNLMLPITNKGEIGGTCQQFHPPLHQAKLCVCPKRLKNARRWIQSPTESWGKSHKKKPLKVSNQWLSGCLFNWLLSLTHCSSLAHLKAPHFTSKYCCEGISGFQGNHDSKDRHN